MKIKEIIYEDYVNYRKPSLFIGVCECDWKCCKEDSACRCQNQPFANYPTVSIPNQKIISQYLANPLTHAIVFGGLEPLRQWEEVKAFINEFRTQSDDDVVIYTGYYPHEIENQLKEIIVYPNIFFKFGRYRVGDKPHYDEVLGVELPNKEQYGKRLS